MYSKKATFINSIVLQVDWLDVVIHLFLTQYLIIIFMYVISSVVNTVNYVS